MKWANAGASFLGCGQHSPANPRTEIFREGEARGRARLPGDQTSGRLRVWGEGGERVWQGRRVSAGEILQPFKARPSRETKWGERENTKTPAALRGRVGLGERGKH